MRVRDTIGLRFGVRVSVRTKVRHNSTVQYSAITPCNAFYAKNVLAFLNIHQTTSGPQPQLLDSNQPGAKREVRLVGKSGTEVVIEGEDESGNPFECKGTLNGKSGMLTVDFGPKQVTRVWGGGRGSQVTVFALRISRLVRPHGFANSSHTPSLLEQGEGVAAKLLGQVVSYLPLSEAGHPGIVWQDGSTWEKV